jgi:hypothetical protein
MITITRMMITRMPMMVPMRPRFMTAPWVDVLGLDVLAET